MIWVEFRARFHGFSDSRSEEVFNQDWNDIKSQVLEGVAKYIQHQWMDAYAGRFCELWLSHDLHRGYRHTSRVESVHLTLKDFLANFNQGLFSIYLKLKQRVEDQLDAVILERKRERQSWKDTHATSF